MAGRRLLIYSLSHFIVDFSCALLLLGVVCPQGDAALCLLVYNFCAFACQAPLGLLADSWGRNHLVAAGGCLLAALAWLLAGPAAAACAGLGNALFHVGGGLDTLNRSEKKAGALGVFVSPGAFGIYCGSLAAGGSVPPLFACFALLVMAALIAALCRAGGNAPLAWPRARPQAWLAVALCLFLVVVLRSYLGLLFDFPWKSGYGAAFVCAVALGKAAGGLLGDIFGLQRTALVTLALSALLFLFPAQPVCGLAAVFLFNMTMPLTLWAMARLLPGAKGFSFGLLTLALFLGYLPVFLGLPAPLGGPALYAAGALLSLPLLCFGLRGAKRPC